MSRALTEARRAYHAQRTARDPVFRERKRRYAKAWRADNPARVSYNNARRRYGEGVTYEEFEAVWYGSCFSCGLTPARGVDHIIGETSGGRNALDNLQPMCVPCNNRKARRLAQSRLPTGEVSSS